MLYPTDYAKNYAGIMGTGLISMWPIYTIVEEAFQYASETQTFAQLLSHKFTVMSKQSKQISNCKGAM